jgi:hypothetical protein
MIIFCVISCRQADTLINKLHGKYIYGKVYIGILTEVCDNNAIKVNKNISCYEKCK